MTNEMERCKDCRWWEQDNQADAKGKSGSCEKLKKVLIVWMDMPAAVQWVYSPENFGCIHFTNKTDGGE